MYETLEQVQQANRQAGRHWFEPDTLEFFESIMESEIIAGRFFITSEKLPHGDRMFSVREAHEDGHISTVGTFCYYANLYDAEAAVAELVGDDDDHSYPDHMGEDA